MRRHRGCLRSEWALAALAAGMVLAASAPARAVEPAGQPYGDLGQALVALAIFGLLLLILGKFAWKPVIAQLKRRETELAEIQHDAERRQREAKELEEHYRLRMERAEAEAGQILAKGLSEAAKTREELLAAARDEGAAAIEAVRTEIKAFKRTALEDLQQATARLAVNIAEQILREEITADKQKKLVDDSLERIQRRVAEDER